MVPRNVFQQEKHAMFKFSFALIPIVFLLASCTNSQVKRPLLPDAGALNLEVATFAGGCFWCIESGFEKLEGVKEAISGYTGGDEYNPSYQQVASGSTGHVEAVQVFYDPEITSYQQLIEAHWRQINPTDSEGQFNDRGRQYRPAIFYHNDQQQKIARDSRHQLNQSGRYDQPVVTEILPLKQFWPAENENQDYYKRNPIRYWFFTSGSGRGNYLQKIWGDEL